jgi:hypothetical protein
VLFDPEPEVVFFVVVVCVSFAVHLLLLAARAK